MSEPTKFVAIVNKVQTLADNGLRVYLDLPEQAICEVAELMLYKRDGVVVDVAVTPKQNESPAGQEDESTAVSRTKAKKRVEQGDPGVQ